MNIYILMKTMNYFNENGLLITELCELIIKDCCEQLNNIQNCGLLIDICNGNETLATGLAITDSNKTESWLINDMQIFDKTIILREKMGKKWDSMFLVINLKNNQFSVEYYAGVETSWRKSVFDHIGEWTYYTKIIEKL